MARTRERVFTTAEDFYRSALQTLTDSEHPFMVAGAYALGEYTGIHRDTKDLDVFCTPGEYPLLLEALANAGYQTEITDANWIAKARRGEYYVDLIFNSSNSMVRILPDWYQRAPEREVCGVKIKVIPVTEMIWSKLYIEDRFRYDGADVNHLILCQANAIDWHLLLDYMDRDWELLFSHLINFRFVYPAERDLVPRWLLDDLIGRTQRDFDLPSPQDRVCRGPFLSRTQYQIDIDEWGFKTT